MACWFDESMPLHTNGNSFPLHISRVSLVTRHAKRIRITIPHELQLASS